MSTPINKALRQLHRTTRQLQYHEKAAAALRADQTKLIAEARRLGAQPGELHMASDLTRTGILRIIGHVKKP